MAEGDKTEVVELELGSSDKNDLWNLQKLCSRHWSCSEVESVDHISADTALKWTSGIICHSRYWGPSKGLFAYHSTFASWDHCWRCILEHQTCSLHFGLDLFMELTRH
jgi:hypothetical protein